MAHPWLVLGALVIEATIGYPAAVQRIFPHPVAWAGRAIAALDASWNNPKINEGRRKLRGMVAVVLLALTAGLLAALLQGLFAPGFFAAAALMLFATVGLAQRSLYDHVGAVAAALESGDLVAARAAVGRIVGRDVDSLDADGVAAAALESLAESFNDGVVAPAFWLLLGGLPGLFIYKVINTADSMIGHMEPRWRAFGWAAARSDDLMNLIPARIAGGLIALAGRGGWRIMFADAAKHASPNAGWPEAAMAGALGVRLGGPAFYDSVPRERPLLGTGADPRAADLRRGLHIYMRACACLWALLAVGGLLWPR
jgi:adenosylcobinamide-phosphate synthase